MISVAVLLLMAAGVLFIVLNLTGAPVQSAAQDSVKKEAAAGKDNGEAKGPPAAQGPPPALIRVGVVAQKDLQPRVAIIGRFREIRRTIVGSGQQGRVVEMAIEEGDEVSGDPENPTILARIDQTFSNIEKLAVEARLLEAQADEAEAAANVEQATRDRVFFDELEKTNSAKPREVGNARSLEKAMLAKHARAQAAVTSAQQEIRRVEQELLRFDVKAPFDGVVVKKWMEVGQWVQKGAPVVELVSRGQLDAVVDVPERYINSLYKEEKIELRVDALNLAVTGDIQAIVPDGTSAARTYPVKIRLSDREGKLKPGMSITAWLPTGEQSPTITVPRDAVLLSATGSVVWVVIDGKALRVDVDVLFGSGADYAVKASRRNTGPLLAPEMQVVIEGGERLLFPGQAVTISDRR